MRKTLVHFDRNTYAYMLDRTTGEVLRARHIRAAELVHGLRLQDRPADRQSGDAAKARAESCDVCPPDIGQKDWEPPAFSPRTGLVYVGIFNICMDLTDHKVSYIAGTPYDGMEMKRHVGRRAGRRLGRVHRLGPGARQAVVANSREVHGHVGRGRNRRRRRVLRHHRRLVPRPSTRQTARSCSQQKLSSGIIGQPITYLGPDGRQYVAIPSGVGGAAAVQAARDGYPARGSTLYIFSLDGKGVQDGRVSGS